MQLKNTKVIFTLNIYIMKTLLLSLISILALNSYSQNVYIPDANFKSYLVDNSSINTNADNEIQESEASAFTGVIGCNASNISDLTGIEEFTALTWLFCIGNQLTSLDVSSNTALTSLSCGNNPLTTLDIYQNTALTTLVCFENQLTSLDVSNNTELTYLDCANNPLAILNVSQNTALETLDCLATELTSLDVSENAALTTLSCGQNIFLTCLNVQNGTNTGLLLGASNCPNITCIEVDDAVYSTANWFNIDTGVSFSEDCYTTCLSVSLNELSNTPKKLLKIFDIIGRETPFKPNTLLIYVYDDGTTQRVFKLEE